MRNPIAAIQSLAEVTQNASNLDIAKQRNNDVIDASRSLARLTEQLLSYERLLCACCKKSHDFDALVAGILSTIAPKVVDAEVKLSFSGNVKIFFVELDAFLFEQALINIIDNALVHGGNVLNTISVSTHSTKEQVSLSICNDGQAIPKSSRKQLFDRFEQGQSPTGNSKIGNGVWPCYCQRSMHIASS